MDQELLQAALYGLERRRETLDAQIAEVRQRLGGGATPQAAGMHTSAAPVTKRRGMSAAGRARIAEAQRKRWATMRRTASSTAPAKKGWAAAKKLEPAKGAAKKRTMSAEGRKRIIAATKKRWAAFRAAKKAATKSS